MILCKKQSFQEGGLYHHYSNISEILYDIMVDGNKMRKAIIEETITLKKDTSFEELIADIIVEKMLSESDSVSIYAMFLQEIRYDTKLRELYNTLKNESIQDVLSLFEGRNKESLKIYSELIVDLINSIILSCEVLSTRDNFLSNKEVLKKLINDFLENEKYTML